MAQLRHGPTFTDLHKAYPRLVDHAFEHGPMDVDWSKTHLFGTMRGVRYAHLPTGKLGVILRGVGCFNEWESVFRPEDGSPEMIVYITDLRKCEAERPLTPMQRIKRALGCPCGDRAEAKS